MGTAFGTGGELGLGDIFITEEVGCDSVETSFGVDGGLRDTFTAEEAGWGSDSKTWGDKRGRLSPGGAADSGEAEARAGGLAGRFFAADR